MKGLVSNNSLPINKAEARIMHIDLNSCFAIMEQQANRLLRDKPVGVAAYDTPKGFVVAASYQAKAMGVKLGVNVAEARQLCPGIVIVTPDPPKYREAHRRFKEVMLEYSDDVVAKSIDEFVVNLDHSPKLRSGMSMEDIGLDIKKCISHGLGEAVTVNVGIGPNRFLAKFAAGFDKPNGMKKIDHTNLKDSYKGLDLVDLPGINIRYRRRLKEYGIHNPLEFLQADCRKLQKVVFRSIVGRHWYYRLRGYEVDNYTSIRRQIGHQYALPHKTDNKQELARLLMKLCEKVGRRLRHNNLTAGGIGLYLSFINYQELPRGNGFIGGENLQSLNAWHRSHRLSHRLYTTDSIYQATKFLLDQAEIFNPVRGISITVFDLKSADPEQLSLLQDDRYFSANRNLSKAVDEINNRYGEFVITPAEMMDMQGEILDRIAFGSVRDI